MTCFTIQSVKYFYIRSPAHPACTLLHIFPPTFFFENIKKGLRTKVAGHRTANGFVGESSVIVVDLDRFMTSTSCCRVCHQLRLAAFFQTDEPEDRRFDASSDRQQPMVLEQRCLLAAQTSGDVIALLLCEHNAVEAFIQSKVLPQLH